MSSNISTTSMNSIFLGEVASVQSYGAFIRIPGSSHQGLVHRSQISKVNVPDVSEVLAKGDRVWCKVISSSDDGKIGLSMKVVDQGNGKDLDPNGVQMQLDEQRRKEWVPGEKRKTISLDAVFNTTCSKCGTRGHLSKDCFQVAGGKKYDLIPEDEAEIIPTAQTSALPDIELKDKKDEKKEKKDAKRAKKEAKKRKKADKKLKKKAKKEAKRRLKTKTKRKHTSSEDSLDSSDSSSSSSNDSENEQRSRDTHHRENPSSKLTSPSRRHRDRARESRSKSRSPVGDRKRLRSSSDKR